MRKCLFVFVLFFSFQLNHSQSYNTVTFTGMLSAFNDDERKWVGNGYKILHQHMMKTTSML